MTRNRNSYNILIILEESDNIIQKEMKIRVMKGEMILFIFRKINRKLKGINTAAWLIFNLVKEKMECDMSILQGTPLL